MKRNRWGGRERTTKRERGKGTEGEMPLFAWSSEHGIEGEARKGEK